MSKKYRAFTLVELLVVLVVIALLLGLLLPALSTAREQSRCVFCRSNLKNIGMGFRLYLDDSRGAMPSAEPYPGSYGENAQHWFMNSRLLYYLDLTVLSDKNGELTGPGKDRSVLTCPSHRKPDLSRESLPDYPAQERDYSLSYVLNGTLGVSGKCNLPTEYRHESEFKVPSEMLMFCDGHGTTQVPGIVLFDGCAKSNLIFRHRDKANTLFLDLHIASFSEQEVPFCSRFDDRRFGRFWYVKKQ
jgi:prepilin-type N-terminal cleavage/methylation domain-containing protein/prepilin-type processing-associated H-X9-DG protein